MRCRPVRVKQGRCVAGVRAPSGVDGYDGQLSRRASSTGKPKLKTSRLECAQATHARRGPYGVQDAHAHAAGIRINALDKYSSPRPGRPGRSHKSPCAIALIGALQAVTLGQTPSGAGSRWASSCFEFAPPFTPVPNRARAALLLMRAVWVRIQPRRRRVPDRCQKRSEPAHTRT